MKVKDFPLSIRKLIKKRCEEQGSIYDENKHLGHSFSFPTSAENSEFWFDINAEDFSKFYKLYPIPRRYAIKAVYLNTEHHPEFEDYYRSVTHRRPTRLESASNFYIHNNGVEGPCLGSGFEEIDIVDWINWKTLEEINGPGENTKSKCFSIDSYDILGNY